MFVGLKKKNVGKESKQYLGLPCRSCRGRKFCLFGGCGQATQAIVGAASLSLA